MITNFNIFENQETPDLRRLSSYVRCIKDYNTSDIKKSKIINKPQYFHKGDIYKVTGLYGDPQGAIEKYGIMDYIPIELINAIVINYQDFNFKNKKRISYGDNFWEYFELLTPEEDQVYKDSDKYNL
jgi:hypothetical protein